jgi:transglutaminase-like putative cysteine protease
MERFDYKIETSNTPAYSLLRYGVGDSKAFATVYSAMCRNAGLECQVVSGTRSGEAWYWNYILIDDIYYHVDLLADNESDAFYAMRSEDMIGYVWDYSVYP